MTAEIVNSELVELSGLSLADLAADEEAVALVARLTRADDETARPLRVAAFQSYIDVDDVPLDAS